MSLPPQKMGDRPEANPAKENGTGDAEGTAAEVGGAAEGGVSTVEGEEVLRREGGSFSDEPIDTVPSSGFKKIYIGKIVNPRQVWTA